MPLRPAEAQVAILGRLTRAGTCWPTRLEADGLEGDCAADGSAGAADEPEHAAAPRRSGELPTTRWLTTWRPTGRRGGDPPLASVPVPVPGGVPERRRRSAAEDQGRAAPGGRDRLRQRAGAAGPGRHRSGRVGLDAVAGHGQPWPRRDEQDALRGRGGIVRRGASCAATRTACHSVRRPRASTRRLDPQDTILSLAERLAQYGGGGTNCSLPLAGGERRSSPAEVRRLRAGQRQGELDRHRPARLDGDDDGVAGVREEPGPACTAGSLPARRLVCIDLQPYTTTQAPDRSDILNVGGFSDAVFEVVAAFFTADPTRFVAEVEAVEL